MNKLNYVIMGSNLNPLYYDFWPVVSKVWKEIFNITPVLGLICDEDSELIQSEYGLIKKFKKIEGADDGFLSQIIRLYLPKFLNGYCLMSDIDMIPLSKSYFSDNSSGLTENNVIIYSSDNIDCISKKQYPMCYISSHSKTFSKIFGVDESFYDFVQKIKLVKGGWFTDQIFLYEKLSKYENKIMLNRGWSGGIAYRRIDRIYWSYSPEKVKEEYYIDCHSLRPYSIYKEEIKKLINLLYENENNYFSIVNE